MLYLGLSNLDALHNHFGHTESCDHMTSLGPASSRLHKTTEGSCDLFGAGNTLDSFSSLKSRR